MQAAERQLHEQLKQLFMRRVTVVHDSHATGDQVVHQVAMVTPPGHHARILGCQNIKGTGLDFVYRWVSLAQVVQSLERLFNERGARAEMLAWLSGYGDYGLIDAELTLRKLEPLLVPGDPDWLEQREALSVLVKSLRELVQTKKNRLIGHSKVGPLARLVNAFEPWIDHLDSIYRARRANAIVQDLFSNRVGQARAARLLREVVARGKGGWLYDGLRSFFHSDK
jgi:hypothetical protein